MRARRHSMRQLGLLEAMLGTEGAKRRAQWELANRGFEANGFPTVQMLKRASARHASTRLNSRCLGFGSWTGPEDALLERLASTRPLGPSEEHRRVVAAHAALWRRSRRRRGAVVALGLLGPLPADVGGRELEPCLVEGDVEGRRVVGKLLDDRQVVLVPEERDVGGEAEDRLAGVAGGLPLVLPSRPHLHRPVV